MLDFIVYSNEIRTIYKQNHPHYAYSQRIIADGADNGQLNVSIYEVPPGKSAYPYHYHHKRVEVYYIASGIGLLRTATGEQVVTPGDVFVFLPHMHGAHMLTNLSETELLCYLDVGTHHDLDLSYLVDSGKVSVHGEGIRGTLEPDATTDSYKTDSYKVE